MADYDANPVNDIALHKSVDAIGVGSHILRHLF